MSAVTGQWQCRQLPLRSCEGRPASAECSLTMTNRTAAWEGRKHYNTLSTQSAVQCDARADSSRHNPGSKHRSLGSGPGQVLPQRGLLSLRSYLATSSHPYVFFPWAPSLPLSVLWEYGRFKCACRSTGHKNSSIHRFPHSWENKD